MPHVPSRHAARQNSSFRRSLLLLAGLPVLAGLALGCDQSNPDDAAAAQTIREVNAQRAVGKPVSEYASAAETAANSSATSGGMSSVANLLSGDISRQVAAANLVGVGDQPGLIESQAQATLLAQQMQGVASSIRSGQQYAMARQDSEPTDVYTALESAANTMETGDVWKPTAMVSADSETPADISEMATIATLDSQIADLEKQIQDTQSQLDQLDEQRRAALSEASTADTEASASDDYDTAMTALARVRDKRTEASQQMQQITTLEARKSILESTLEQANQTRAALQAGIESIQAQRAELQNAYNGDAGVTAQIRSLRQQLDAAYSGSGENSPSVTSLAATFGEIWTNADSLRNDVMSDLDAASSKFETAASKARTAANEGSSQFQTVTRSASAVPPFTYEVTVTNRMKADVLIGDAGVYAALVDLKKTLEAAQREMPSEVGVSEPGAAFEGAVTEAATILDGVISTLDESVIGQAQGPLLSAALTEKAIAVQALASLRNLVDRTGLAGDAVPTADAINGMVNEVASAASGENIMLPRLPAFNGVTPPAPTEPADDATDEDTGDDTGDEAMTPDNGGDNADDEGDAEGDTEGDGAMEEGDGNGSADEPADEPSDEPTDDPEEPAQPGGNSQNRPGAGNNPYNPGNGGGRPR